MNEEQAAKLRAFDEAQTFMVDCLPPMWKSLFDKCVSEGFSESQSLSLLKCFILRDGMHGVHIHKD